MSGHDTRRRIDHDQGNGMKKCFIERVHISSFAQGYKIV